MQGVKPHVKISGPLLSKILHEKYKSKGSSSGLLYGETATLMQSEITDSQHTTRTEPYIRIRDYLPNLSINILKEKSQNTAWMDKKNSPSPSCVGIFRIRKPSSVLSLLEKSMHRKLLRELEAKTTTKAHDFIVSLIITHQTDAGRTCLTWKIAAYVLIDGNYTTVQVDISNLQGSVSSSFMKGPSPVTSVESKGASAILHNFQSSLTDSAGAISVVEVTRKTTINLISELESAFSALHRIEKKCDEALDQRSALLSQLNYLSDKRRLHQSPKKAPSAPSKTFPQAPRKMRESEENPENMCDDGDECQSAHNKLDGESAFIANRKKSLKDMEKRSAVVVLERLRIDDGVMKHNSHKPESSAATGSMDPFASLVLSAKEKLKYDIAELADEVGSEDMLKNAKTVGETFGVSRSRERGGSPNLPDYQETG